MRPWVNAFAERWYQELAILYRSERSVSRFILFFVLSHDSSFIKNHCIRQESNLLRTTFARSI